jgi:hypothetical protein
MMLLVFLLITTVTCGAFLILWTWIRDNNNTHHISSSKTQPIATDPAVVDTFRLYQYEQIETSECCSVCLSDFETLAPIRELPCKHIFHDGCITKWLARSTKCPMCTQDVRIDLDPICAHAADMILAQG